MLSLKLLDFLTCLATVFILFVNFYIMLANCYHFPEKFNFSLFNSVLKTKWIGRSFLYRERVGSTMDLIQREASEGASGGTTCLAECQTKGRGRVNRPWESASRGNIYCSVLLYPKSFTELPKINIAISIAMSKALRHYDGIEAKIKWPNDVWVKGKKIAGILVDTSSMGSQIHAVIGFGINVNEDMEKHENEEVRSSSTSLFSLTQQMSPREELLANTLNYFEELLALDYKQVLEEYTKYDLVCGNDIIVMPKKKESFEKYEAKAVRIDEYGYLVVKTKDGEELTLVHEEVSIRPNQLQ